jgi:hypothetical protein
VLEFAATHGYAAVELRGVVATILTPRSGELTAANP